jgi:C1A family cysteine protease
MLSLVTSILALDEPPYTETTPTRVYPRGFVRQPIPPEDLPHIKYLNITDADIAAMPRAIDWSKQGATTPIKDQGSCGSW